MFIPMTSPRKSARQTKSKEGVVAGGIPLKGICQ